MPQTNQTTRLVTAVMNVDEVLVDVLPLHVQHDLIAAQRALETDPSPERDYADVEITMSYTEILSTLLNLHHYDGDCTSEFYDIGDRRGRFVIDTIVLMSEMLRQMCDEPADRVVPCCNS